MPLVLTTGDPLWFALVAVVAVSMGAAAIRSAYRKPPNWSGPLMATPRERCRRERPRWSRKVPTWPCSARYHSASACSWVRPRRRSSWCRRSRCGRARRCLARAGDGAKPLLG
ncbi:hypothetical protein NKG05_01020 [Oerskovia sp. M15]